MATGMASSLCVMPVGRLLLFNRRSAGAAIAIEAFGVAVIERNTVWHRRNASDS